MTTCSYRKTSGASSTLFFWIYSHYFFISVFFVTSAF